MGATRRLVGIDLGIASAHTVRVLDETGRTVAKRKAWPTVASLAEVEAAALSEAPGTRLEVVVEPTGPAWLPIAVYFTGRGHLVYRVSSAKAADLRRFLSRHTRPTASTRTRWRGCRCSTRPGCSRCSCPARSGRRWTGGCAPPTG
jgi:hypothetical protein